MVGAGASAAGEPMAALTRSRQDYLKALYALAPPPDGHPEEDPHGHPIPDGSGRMRRRRLTPLSAVASGARAVVREIRDADVRRMARWKDAGLVPGAAVRMRDVQPLDDVFVIEIGRRRI